MGIDWKISLFKTHADERDVEAASAVIRRGTYWADGPEVPIFESAIARFFDRRFAVAFNSGTSALVAILKAYELEGSEVIVPTFTFISTANSVVLAGATPVFADSEHETFGLDIDDVKKRITEKTRAIMPMHYGGNVSRDILALRDLCQERNLLLIEDAAESMGASIRGQKVGAIGDAAMTSFCQNKIISTGEGGVIVTDDEDVYQKLKLYRSHGRYETSDNDYFSSTDSFDYISLGQNYRMPSMCAALGSSQLDKVDELIAKRQEIGQRYNRAFSEIREIASPIASDGVEHVYQMYTIALQSEEMRDALQNHMSEQKIMTKVYFAPAHMMTYYQSQYSTSKGMLPKSEALAERVLTLPLYPDLTKDEQEFVISSVLEFF